MRPQYDIFIIGGEAGLTVAFGSAQLGAVLLVDQKMLSLLFRY